MYKSHCQTVISLAKIELCFDSALKFENMKKKKRYPENIYIYIFFFKNIHFFFFKCFYKI